MGFSKLKLERTFLSSKVARRVFLMFILSSLVPLGALAYLAVEQVTTQLKEQAEQRLHHASKATGMTLFERLSFLETDLQAILTDLQGGSAADLERATWKLGDRRISRFRTFALATIEGQMLSRIGPGMELPALTGEERTHLLAGHTLVTSCRAQGSMPGIFLARAADPGSAAAAAILWGEISSEYLWGGDGFIFPSMELCALGSPEHVLFSTLSDRIPRTELKIAMEKNAASGGFEWTDGGTTYLASYWTLFMRPTFFPSWILIQSETKDIILEPLQSFRKTFALVVLLTFWIVALLSLTQIRSSLNPIEQLRQATLDIAQKNFQSRVRIQSKDEFAELGASFNSMVESLENHVNVMNTINRIGTSLSAEKDAQRLLHIILRGAMTVINADGAALYLMTQDQKLELAAVNIDSLELTSGSGTAPSPPVDRFLSNHGGDEPAALSMIHDRTINVPDIYRESS
jgi:HAMP domain-containing protein